MIGEIRYTFALSPFVERGTVTVMRDGELYRVIAAIELTNDQIMAALAQFMDKELSLPTEIEDLDDVLIEAMRRVPPPGWLSGTVRFSGAVSVTNETPATSGASNAP